MSPDSATVIRKKLRYLRTAQHNLMLAADLEGVEHDDIADCAESVDKIVQRVLAELTAMRDGQ